MKTTRIQVLLILLFITIAFLIGERANFVSTSSAQNCVQMPTPQITCDWSGWRSAGNCIITGCGFGADNTVEINCQAGVVTQMRLKTHDCSSICP